MSRTPVSRETFRRACARFATGIAVATVLDASGNPHGLTVNSFTSVSADPPLVLFCIDKSCSILEHFLSFPSYGLSFLAEDQQELSNRFATLPEGRFQGVSWSSGAASGVPLLDGALARLDCQKVQTIEAGDHFILLAEVVAADIEPGDGSPLLYFASSYRTVQR